MAAKPPLSLEVTFRSTDGDGGKTFTHYNTETENGATLGPLTTKLGTGFESASCTLHRDFRKSYPSPRIMQEMVVKGAGGVVWEGRVDRVPPSRADDVQASGWWQALKDTGGVSEVYSDKSMERWGGTPLNRRIALDGSYKTEDAEIADAGIVTKLAQPIYTASYLPTAEAWYTAPPGVNLYSVAGTWAQLGASLTGNASYNWGAYLATDDAAASNDSSGDLQAAGPASYSLTTSTAGRRFAVLYLLFSTTTGTNDSITRSVRWTDTEVTGDHGITTIYASEVIKHAIGKYCPLLTADSSTVTDTTHEIGQLVFDGATVEDVVLKCNGFHLFDIGVWENRTLHFNSSPALDDYDYELDIYEGADLSPAGPEVDDDEPANGVWVYYTDVATGRAERVGPYGTGSNYDSAGDTGLLVSDDENPVNREGQTRFPKLDVSNNCTRADAIVMGALWLSERQIPTTVGTGSATGHVKNRAGQWVPAYQIRAGDRVKYKHETGVIRRVYSTNYDPQTFVNSLTYERPASTVDGIFERIGVSLQAAGAA